MTLLPHLRRLPALFTVLLPTLMLAGCAATPARPTFTLYPGDTIGLLVDTADAPVHTHYEALGGNVERSAARYPVDWRLDAAVTDIIRRELTLAGFNVVDLEAQGLRYDDVVDSVGAAGGQWQPAPGARHPDLRQQGMRAVVLVRDARTVAVRDCNGGPCERIAEGPGLYSSSVNGVTSWRAVAGFEWHVFLLDPPGDLAAAPPLRDSLQSPSVPLLGFSRPQNPVAPTEAELATVRDKTLQYVEATAEDAVLALTGRRVVEARAAVTAGGAASSGR